MLLGPRLAKLVDRLADRTGMGEALAGAILLGATTSLPGIVTTAVAAAEAAAPLAVSNALGGIAAQTMFLALADLRYPRANLEHAAASLPNLLQSLFLVCLLALVMLAATGPDVTVGLGAPGHLRPAGGVPVRPGAHPLGGRVTHVAAGEHRGRPASTSPRRAGATSRSPGCGWASPPRRRGWPWAGWVVGRAGVSLAAETPLSGTVVGGLLTSVVTSLPELVTALAAVRIGALTLAVGDIIGGQHLRRAVRGRGRRGPSRAARCTTPSAPPPCSCWGWRW